VTIRYQCSCGKTFALKDGFAGRQVACPSCKKVGIVGREGSHDSGRTCKYCKNPLGRDEVTCPVCATENATLAYSMAKAKVEKGRQRGYRSINTSLIVILVVLVIAGGAVGGMIWLKKRQASVMPGTATSRGPAQKRAEEPYIPPEVPSLETAAAKLKDAVRATIRTMNGETKAKLNQAVPPDKEPKERRLYKVTKLDKIAVQPRESEFAPFKGRAVVEVASYVWNSKTRTYEPSALGSMKRRWRYNYYAETGWQKLLPPGMN